MKLALVSLSVILLLGCGPTAPPATPTPSEAAKAATALSEFTGRWSGASLATPTAPPPPGVGDVASNPIPFGQWGVVAANASVRVLKIEKQTPSKSLDLKSGENYWHVTLEAKYDGPSDSSHGFSPADVATLDSHREIASNYVYSPDAEYRCQLLGGGSKVGKVGLIADNIELLVYRDPAKRMSAYPNVYFAVR